MVVSLLRKLEKADPRRCPGSLAGTSDGLHGPSFLPSLRSALDSLDFSSERGDSTSAIDSVVYCHIASAAAAQESNSVHLHRLPTISRGPEAERGWI